MNLEASQMGISNTHGHPSVLAGKDRRCRVNKIIIPLPVKGSKYRDIHRYNQTGELVGVQDVSDWQDDEVKQLAVAIQKRGDGSYAALKKRSGRQNEAR